jgi:hypothetical protein
MKIEIRVRDSVDNKLIMKKILTFYDGENRKRFFCYIIGLLKECFDICKRKQAINRYEKDGFLIGSKKDGS